MAGQKSELVHLLPALCCAALHFAGDAQIKHVKFSAEVDEGHGTIKRKATAFAKMRAPVEDEEEDEDEQVFPAFWIALLHELFHVSGFEEYCLIWGGG